MTPLLKRAIITSEEAKILFPSVEAIFNVNATLLKSLDKRMNDGWRFHTKLGDIFVAMVDFLKIYSTFVTSYTGALRLLVDKETHSPEFRAAVQSANSDRRTHGNDIRSLLVMPIQRLPRYILLLGEYRAKLPPDLPDYESIERAEVRLKEITKQVNDKQRDTDRSVRRRPPLAHTARPNAFQF